MNYKPVLAILIILFLFGGIAALSMYTSRIPMNDENTCGNTAGNLYNKGLFCEDDNIVYFSNPYQNGDLYSMTLDETEVKQLLDYNVKYINAAGKFLYYYQDLNNASSNLAFANHMVGVYRSKKNGTRVTCLKKEPSGTISLVGNYLYYEHYTNKKKEGMTLYKTKIDKSDETQVVKYIIDPSCVVNGSLYYAGREKDHNLYRLDSASDSISLVAKGRFWNPTVIGDNVYYMNVSDDYTLHCYSLSTGDDLKLTNDRIDSYNVTGEYIYYQKNGTDDAALKRIRTDGSEEEIVMEGIFTDINATSRYVYFHPFGSDTPMYHTPVIGPVSVSEFTAAQVAAP